VNLAVYILCAILDFAEGIIENILSIIDELLSRLLEKLIAQAGLQHGSNWIPTA